MTARVTLRPTIAADLPAVIAEALPLRIRAITAVLHDPPAADRVIGVGGIAWLPDGRVLAFVQAPPEAKRYPVSFHRAGLMAMAMIRNSGAREVIATTDADSAINRGWLARLGFRDTGRESEPGKVIYIWTR